MDAIAAAFDISDLAKLYSPDADRIELAKRRQVAVWEGGKPDLWPILMDGELTPEQEAIPQYSIGEAFHDADSMLCNNVRAACRAAGSGSDIVPSMRANMGTGMTLACLGLEQLVFDDRMPWLKSHLTKQETSALTPEDIEIQGTFEAAMNQMRRFQEVIGDTIPIYCPDTQGPFDLAHLLMGDDLFLECYDDPPFVHHLLEICLEVGIRTHTWTKQLTGEPLDRIYHSNSLYAENMGIRTCEDTTALISSDHIEEFAMPYTGRLAAQFGGAWIHYCGRNDNLTEAILQMEEVRGINFGHIPGHEHDHPFETDMENICEAGKVYFGNWPVYENESATEYLKRLHMWASRGCLIPHVVAEKIVGNGGFSSREAALEHWYSL